MGVLFVAQDSYIGFSLRHNTALLSMVGRPRRWPQILNLELKIRGGRGEVEKARLDLR
jgi:hypothetical protein